MLFRLVGVAAMLCSFGCSEPPAPTLSHEGGAGGEGGSGGGGEGGRAVVEPTSIGLPSTGLSANQVVVLANINDPQSLEVAAYYQAARDLPSANVVMLDFPVPLNGYMTAAEFEDVQAQLDALTPSRAQAYALAFTSPYRVECMSATSAFALGYHLKYCGGCAPTEYVPYFNSRSTQPWTDFGIRPTMMLAATSVDDAKELIDRGVDADDTLPGGDGYLVRTVDQARSVRWPQFERSAAEQWAHRGALAMTYMDNALGMDLNYVENTDDVLFYFTGLTSVPQIASNTYLPGAVADHLTSWGGIVPAGPQMTALAWLEAGLTASYGTVTDPCFYTAKYPDITVLIPQYFRGATVLEAYWKSVAWPGEGLFVGEPLARPWGKSHTGWSEGTLTIETNLLEPLDAYEIVGADDEGGPWTVVEEDIRIATHQRATITHGPTTYPHYRLRRRGEE